MKRFNVRVYGLWIINNEVLVSEEWIAGAKIVKLPGGGLEWGEGTIDAVKREWKEEMNAEIRVLDHFYTTDYFQKSAWDESQVSRTYYFVEPSQPLALPHYNGKEHFYFVPISNLISMLSLPIDIAVANKLHTTFHLSSQ